MKLTKIIVVILATVLLLSSCTSVKSDDDASSDYNKGQIGDTVDNSDGEEMLKAIVEAEEWAVELVSQMTQEEKYSQLTANEAPAIPRLGIKAYNWWSEGLHGVARDGEATCFATGLSIAASWNTELVEDIISATSDEAREKFNSGRNTHGLNYWSPTINMARDPRWGRAEETYGEDPYLTSMIADAYIKGLQGDFAATGEYKAIATAKHFLGNNSEFNRHNGSSDIDDRDLHEYYMRAFQYAVEESKVGAVMTSYNAVNGTPMSVNKDILDGVLRRNWGFDGFVVTDCGALQDVAYNHAWGPAAYSPEKVAAYAIDAGTDLNCGWMGMLANNAGTAVNSGLLTEGDVDRALVRLFTARYLTGEFADDGGSYGGNQFEGEIQCEEHQVLALKSAEEGVVLLKNEGALPFKADSNSSYVLIGDLGNEVILGDYSTDRPQNTVSPEKGIRRLLKDISKDIDFTYIEGSSRKEYLMNSKNLRLLDKDGNVLQHYTYSNDLKTSTIRFEGDGNNINTGYSTPSSTNWVMLPAGTLKLDPMTVSQFSLELSGASNTEPTRVEIRAKDPENGPLLGVIENGKGDTGGWSSYIPYVFDADLGGGYANDDIYIIFKPISTEVTFTAEQLDAIKKADGVILYVGTRPGENGYKEESDGYNLDLPNNQSELVKQVAQLNSNVVVYIQAVSQVDIEDFKDDVSAILWCTYNGQAQGEAMANILFGKANPSGKLPFTWYSDVDDLAHIDDYNIREGNGRTYQYFKGDITYPFGYGLSYTEFEYSNLSIDKTEVTPNDVITVSFEVTNTGDIDGMEVAQLYISAPDGNDRPIKQLKGYDKKLIKAGDTEKFELTVNASDLWFWDNVNSCQTYDEGIYTLSVGGDSASCENMSLTFTLSGELDIKLKTVRIIPSGHILKKGETLTTETTAVFNNQSYADLGAAEVIYTSSNDKVAAVDNNGNVTAVGKGVATITVSITIDGVTKTDSFAVAVK